MEKISNLIFSRNLIKFTKTILIKRQLMTSTTIRAKEALEKLKKNEYYEKYANKIAKLQQTSPEEFLTRIEQHENEIKEKIEKELKENQYSQLLNPKQPITTSDINNSRTNNVKEKLDNIMKVELIKDKTVEEITNIWMEYHLNKTNYISALIPSNDYDELIKNSMLYPTFLFALPRTQGYEFIMCQFDKNSIHFTPLLYYQVHKENAPECLTIHHYTELKDNKGIVLMRGEFDDKIIDLKSVQCLISQLQLYYIKPKHDKLKLLEIFTKKPEQFKHMDLVREIENLTL